MTPKKILRFIISACIFLVPFVPLVVTGSLFFPFITGKNLLFRILVEVMAVSWIVLALRDVEYRPKKSLLLYAFTAFVAIMAVADALALNSGKAFWSNFERMEGWVTLAHLFAYFVVLGSYLKDEKTWSKLFHTSLGVATFMSFYGMAQLAGMIQINQGGVRLDATLGNATYFAIYMIFHVFLALLFALRALPRYGKAAWYGALALLFAVMMVYTATRGAAVGLVAGLLLFAALIAIFERKEKILRKSAIGLLVAIGVLVGGFLLIKDTDLVRQSPVLSRFAAISFEDFKGSARSIVWPMAIEGFKEKPILGWGQENFNYVFNANYDPRMYGQEQWFDRTHNVILDWLIAGGILGLLAYLSLFAGGVYVLWRKSNLTLIEKSLMTGLLAAYFIHNFFVFDNIVSYILFVTVLGYLYSHAGTPFARLARVDTEINDVTLAKGALPVGLIAAIALVWSVNWQAYASSASLIDALRLANSTPKNGPAIVAAFEKALSYDSVGQSEIRERLVENVPTINNSDAPIETKQAFYDLGQIELKKQLEETPLDARYHLFTGNFYLQYGETDLAIEHTSRALELSPNKQSIMYQLGNMHFAKGDLEKAIATFKEAYDVLPENEEALKYYAMALMYSGDTVRGEALLEERYGTAIIPEPRLAQVYIDLKQWNEAAAVWESLIKADPANIDHRLKLAGTLIQAGRRQESVAVIREIIELRPEFKEQGEYYITEIQAGRNP